MTRTTIADVAKAAGVSVSTVSRALRGLDRVNPETRQRVEAEANRLHFSFSKSASSLASGKTMRVAVLLPSEISSWFNSHAFEGAYEVLSAEGYDVIPYILWSQKELDRFFQNLPGNRNVDAIIVASFDFDEAKKQVLGELTIPMVGMNTPSAHGLDAGAAIDDIAAMGVIVRFLKSLGHTTLAYVGQPINASPFICSDAVRENGFLQAAEACGYGNDDIIVIPSLRNMDVRNEQDIYSGIVAQLLSAPKQPTGICVSVDAAAAPLLKELRRMGWRVPQDMSVVGFDDDPSASIVDLTTMHQNPTEIGRVAARKTLALLAGETLEEPFSIMPTSLVLRGTTERIG
ncbi:LacI family DNA-binding transcriptional regulator [Bifidobacterium moukalabense]|uniref:LacI family DNA-binding transcriptional regulator n=1 Tax=Bifidobacterium moukalabense TaxID=1333651 RepID=UPI0010F45A27|nr:LacI family DNA-binding transcriptional regulator [Bifidobacterium moukalabense]